MLRDIEKRLYAGGSITFEEALRLGEISHDEVSDLLSTASRVSFHFNGRQMEFCSIVNARSGRCSEDCRFCAQSIHYRANIDNYALISNQKVLERAKKMETSGVKRYSLVTSGKGLAGIVFEQVLEMYRELRTQTNLKLCASLGILSVSQLKMLKDVGVTTYHHNLESSRTYYSQICTTHSFEQRLQTIENAKEAGLRVCSGGIIGLGEGWRDRVEMAYELKNLGAASVPINILQPISGTPLEKQKPLSRYEILKTLAVFRLILPGVLLRLAGGRECTLGEHLPEALCSGVNALLVGSYLTTAGQTIEKDQNTAAAAGFIF